MRLVREAIRTGIEAALLIAAPFAALAGGIGAVGMIAATAGAFLLVLLTEVALGRRDRAEPESSGAPEPE